MLENFSCLIKTAQMVKNLNTTAGDCSSGLLGKVPCGRECSLLCYLPMKSHAQEEPGGYSPWCCKKSYRTEQITLSFSLSLS